MTTDSSRSMPAVGPPSRAKILIVDDTPSNRVAFTSILEGPRHEVLEARDGLEALEMIISHDFAVILLDIRMPRMGGLEAAQNIRARKRSRYTPIIFLSAYESTPIDVSRGYVIGGVIDYLFSPVDPDMLRSKVSFLADLYLRNLESQKEVQDLRERVQAHELRIQELQRLAPDPQPPARC